MVNGLEGLMGLTGDRGAVFVFGLAIEDFAVALGDFDVDVLALDLHGGKAPIELGSLL